MNRTSVNSTSLVSVGYDEKTQTLEIEFYSGQIYQYFDVPEGVYKGLLSDASPGSFLSANIKGIYRFART